VSVPPAGVVLVRTLKALGISQAELARQAGLSTKHVNQVIKAGAPISPAVAAAIGESTGIPAEVWIVLDAIHRVQDLGTT
jgi:plasmid maintenance system antidote protein VapI